MSSVKAAVGLNECSHQACEPGQCKVECIAALSKNLKRYMNELSKAFFRGENVPGMNSWWLSGFYSLCIQSMVRKALLQISIPASSKDATIAGQTSFKEYLHLPVRLFIAMLGSYDPLVGPSQPTWKSSLDSVHRPHPHEYTSARLAVRQADWISRGISSSGDYLRGLFEDRDNSLN